ncbi:hypothetical protein [Burkholderia sp. LMG 32019]|uniref:hypothetical protein n=1 Tax=Burkholderia sp. LMG 32019 TaxID=3158173 RepID=UPI003C2BEA81
MHVVIHILDVVDRWVNRLDLTVLIMRSVSSGWAGIRRVFSLGVALQADDGRQPVARRSEGVCPHCACRLVPAASRAAQRAPVRVSVPRPVSRPARAVAHDLAEPQPRASPDPAARLRYVRVPQQPVSLELMTAARRARETESWEAQKERLEAEAADAGVPHKLSRLELLVLLDLGPVERAQYWRQRRLPA